MHKNNPIKLIKHAIKIIINIDTVTLLPVIFLIHEK